jgi:hypothetical protein
MSLNTRTPSQPKPIETPKLGGLVVQNSGTRPVNLRRTWETFKRWDNFTIGNLSHLKHSRENDLLREPRWDGTLRPKGDAKVPARIGKIFLTTKAPTTPRNERERGLGRNTGGWVGSRIFDRSVTHKIGDPVPTGAGDRQAPPGTGHWKEIGRWVGTPCFNR